MLFILRLYYISLLSVELISEMSVFPHKLLGATGWRRVANMVSEPGLEFES
jgi:hypothetical protein